MAKLPPPSAKFVAMLQNIPRIDGGETILLAVPAADERTYVIAGDKRAMSVLGEYVRIACVNDFDRRCIYLEFILLKLLDKHGIEWIRKKICPFKDLDKAIGVVLGSHCDAPEPHVKDGLVISLSPRS